MQVFHVKWNADPHTNIGKKLPISAQCVIIIVDRGTKNAIKIYKYYGIYTMKTHKHWSTK